MRIQDKKVAINGRLLRTVRLDDEWYEDIGNPKTFIDALRTGGVKADIFTFWQRFPDATPRYDYTHDFEDLAVLPVRSFDDWWNNGIKSRTRGLVRKCEKTGVVVRETELLDALWKGWVR